MPRPRKIIKEENNKENLKNAELKIHAHGRRKTATARVRIYHGKGEIIVNDKPIEEYFPGEVAKKFYQRPFQETGTLGKFKVMVKVEGSGKSGQLGAVVHGIANALIRLNPDFKSQLKKAGLVTRDPRAKERRKYGLAQKARKGKQHPKR